MAKYNLLAALSLALMLFSTGCHDRYPDPDYVVGVIEGDFTRTGFRNEGGKFKGIWDGGDVIALTSSNAEIIEGSDHAPYGYYMASDTGRMVSFMMMDEYMQVRSPFVAYYPDELMNRELPYIQKYTGENPARVPMMAKSPTMYLEFKPICGLMEITLATRMEDIKVASLKISADKPLSGGFYIDDDFNAIVMGNHEVVLDCGAGVPLDATPRSFWVSVPPGTYSEMAILMTATDGRTQKFSLRAGEQVEVRRGRITMCPIEMGSMIPLTPKVATLPAGAQFNIALKGIANPDIDADTFETVTYDSTIFHIRFITGNAHASGTPIGASDVPVYASFDIDGGIMTIATAAEELRTASDSYGMFRYMAGLESVNFEELNTVETADISYAFNHCHNLKSLDLTNARTPQLRNMDNTFSYCHALEGLDMCSLDTRNVMNMRSLFNRCFAIKSLDLRSFNTSRCTIMTYMFYYCTSLEELDISSFNLGNVPATGLNYHFFATPSLRTIRTGADYIPYDGEAPSSYFTGSGTSNTYRTGNNAGGVTFITTQGVADWLAKTNLRWIQSGYNGKRAIPVEFIDQESGEKLNVTWAAN